ncbi:hypothetical protein GOP47_0007445 [Adiantum capillus-veneris]|uniref:Uncharacterized protein n=1 Tax=Adiantum capillus-veneris TaxID=13818 RepID=A0A9D4ZLJ0_ADICA|nr:hypothetical protein GOP47_0007445 [Adiantum capillus-veneris]
MSSLVSRSDFKSGHTNSIGLSVDILASVLTEVFMLPAQTVPAFCKSCLGKLKREGVMKKNSNTGLDLCKNTWAADTADLLHTWRRKTAEPL